MAKKSKIARNEQRKVIVARYATKRLELKKALVDPNGTAGCCDRRGTADSAWRRPAATGSPGADVGRFWSAGTFAHGRCGLRRR